MTTCLEFYMIFMIGAACDCMQASPEHLLSAAIMSAPAALAMAKLSYPETEESHTKTQEDVYIENLYASCTLLYFRPYGDRSDRPGPADTGSATRASGRPVFSRCDSGASPTELEIAAMQVRPAVSRLPAATAPVCFRSLNNMVDNYPRWRGRYFPWLASVPGPGRQSSTPGEIVLVKLNLPIGD